MVPCGVQGSPGCLGLFRFVIVVFLVFLGYIRF